MTVFSNTNNKDVWPVLTLNLEIIGHTGIIRVHPLSTYAKFSEKLTGEIEMLVFRKILRTYLMDGSLSSIIGMKLLLFLLAVLT